MIRPVRALIGPVAVAGALLTAGCTSGTGDDAAPDVDAEPASTAATGDGAGDPGAEGSHEAAAPDGTASETGGNGPATPDQVAAAESLCPVLWSWVTDVGDTFNAASTAMPDLPAAQQRRDRWNLMLDDLEELDRQLLVDVGPLGDDTVLAPLIVEIETGLGSSLELIEGLRTLIDETPEIDEERPQSRASQLIVRVEKVIDVVKPELAPHDTDGSLIASFQQVPACQHAVKDVDDGTPQFNG
jgi:hypothetical protein